jgi:hypothetical protein
MSELNDKMNVVGATLEKIDEQNVADSITLILYIYQHLREKGEFRQTVAKACNCIGHLLRQPALQDLVSLFLEDNSSPMDDCPEPSSEKAPFYVREAFFNLTRKINPTDSSLPENQKKEE